MGSSRVASVGARFFLLAVGMPPRVELTARRERDLSSGHPDYSVWAGEQRVGRIYQQHSLGHEQWFWGLTTVTLRPYTPAREGT